ncbi:MAG: T9SS type A sorting domain-containing protein [Crocinitomicaceae bacterium]|nr:T9SS type A sorting domain-containing protein [Crocinitomicaceae bacterium]
MKNLHYFLSLISLSFLPYTGIGQINFTIDGTTASGGTITETIIDDGISYTLTATHSSGNSATLWDNGGGDLMFYWDGSSSDVYTWTISLEADGTAVNFDLNGIYYASFTSLTDEFNLTNNDGASISSGITVAPGSSGTLSIDTPANASDISSFEIEGLTAYSTILVDFHNIEVTPLCEPNLTVSLSGTTLTAEEAGLDYQWLDCDDRFNPISGATGQSFTPTLSGNYAVEITDGTCIGVSDCINVDIPTTTGFGEEESSNLLRAYPNPVQDFLFVENPEQQLIQIELFNQLGQSVLRIESSEELAGINLERINSGSYFLRVTTEEKILLNEMIIKE